MASSDSQIDKPQRGRPKRAELPDVNIDTGAQSILMPQLICPSKEPVYSCFAGDPSSFIMEEEWKVTCTDSKNSQLGKHLSSE